MWNTVILHPMRKLAVERDAYGGPKCRSNIFSNEDEVKKWDTLSKERVLKNVVSKNRF